MAHLEGNAFFEEFPELLEFMTRVEEFERDLEEETAKTPAVVTTTRTAPAPAAPGAV